MLQMGIIGFGGMAQFHREEIETMDDIKIKGVYDIDEKRQAFAQSLGLNAYDSQEALLADEDISLVLVATPNDIHHPAAIAAMRAGKNVICEKPVSLNYKELQEMIDVSKETGMFFTVHQNRRWDEDFLTMKDILNKKMLGDVFRIESRVQGSRGIPGDWRQLPEHGGGMILDWGVHLLDQLLQMVDEKIDKIYAATTNVTNQLVDDGFTADIRFKSGLSALIEVGTSNFISLPRWYMLGQDGTAIIKGWNDDAEIVRAVGESEKDVTPIITAAGLTKTMAPRRKENLHEAVVPLIKSDVREFYYNIVDVLAGKAESKIQLGEVLRVMKLMEAIMDSADRHEAVGFE